MSSISAIITTYQGRAHLAAALDSVLAQTVPPAEILLVDDASTDGTAELAEEYAAREPRIRVLRQPQNGGVGATRNRGLHEARHDLVALLDGDDIWLPTHLETVGGLLAQHPDAALAFALVEAFGARSYVWGAALPAGQAVDAFWPSIEQCVAQTSAVVARRDALLAVGGYAEDLRQCQDYDLYVRLAKRWPFVCTHEVTVRYRKHPGQNSSKLQSCRRFEYTARERFFAAERDARGDEPDYLARLAAAMRRAYEVRFENAWSARDQEMLDFLPELAPRIPGGDGVAARWHRRRPLLPLARLWDIVPAPVKSGVRSMRRAVAR